MTSKAIVELEEEQEWQDTCEACGIGSGLHEYTDEGDPSVGYGPFIVVLCDECADRKGLL